MIVTPLPHTQSHGDLFYRYKRDNEYFGLAEFSIDEFKLDVRAIEKPVKNFFSNGVFNRYNFLANYKDSPDKFLHLHMQAKTYIKLVWLAKEFIDNDRQFKNPLCVHWDLDLGKWVIHPGTVRQFISFLFFNDKFTALTFNNSGKDMLFKKVFASIDEFKDYYKNYSYDFVVTADRGCLIPHVNFDQHTMKLTLQEEFKRVKDFLKFTKLEANFDLKEWGYNKEICIRPNNKVKLTVTEPTDKNIIKSLILCSSFDTYKDEGVTIERT